jgi:ABC-type multidrug transport system fused ATPase/permease subunit
MSVQFFGMGLRLTEHSNQLVGDTSTLSANQMIWRLLKNSERRGLGIIFVMMLIGTVLEMFSLGLVVPIVGLLVNPDYIQRFPIVRSIFGDLTTTQYVLVAMGLLVGVYILKTFFLIWKTWVQRGFSNSVTERIAQDLYKNYLRQPYAFHLERNSAIMIRNSQQSASLMSGIIDPLLLIASEIFVSGGLLALMLLLEPVGSLSAIVVFGSFSVIFRRLTSRRIVKWGEALNFHKGMIIQHLQQGFGGVKDVKILGREDYFIAGYNRDLSGNAYVERRYAVVQTLPRFSMELLTIICLGILVSLMVLSDKAVTDILPVLSLFGAAAFRLLPTLSQVTNSFMSINVNRPILNNLYADLALTVPAIATQKASSNLADRIDISSLSFQYANTTREVLSEVSIDIRRGEAVGLIGSSGSGKSTLVDILLGLLEPTSGRVLVDGNDIHDNLRGWQDQIGYVPQSIFLTDDTLRRNVAFGLPKDQTDHDAVKSAIRSAQLEDFVASLPDGLDTIVGERGVRLSGGQRQRIGIARALYNNPDVLVLDEATSSLDTETEHGVMQAVQALQGEKTVIIVAHRLSTVEYCDRLYRLENARIVDEGTFSEVTSRTKDLPREN